MLDAWLDFSDGVSDAALLAVLQVHRTTLARWRARPDRIPHAARQLVRFHFQGSLPPAAGAGWTGWRFGHRDGLLYAPDLARGFDARDLYELHWLRQSAAWREARAAHFAQQPARAPSDP